jgi:hypothetical protein
VTRQVVAASRIPSPRDAADSAEPATSAAAGRR